MKDTRGIYVNTNLARGVPSVRALRTGGGGGTSVFLPPSGGTGGQGPLAPNILCPETTATVYYEPYNNVQKFGFQGIVKLPTTDPAYAHLKEIDVTAIGPGTASPPYQRTLITTITDWGSSSQVEYKGPVDIQPLTQQVGWSVEFECFDEFGTPTPGPCNKPGLTVNPASIAGDFQASEVGPRYQDESQGLHTVVQAVFSVAGGQYPINVTLWLDEDNGLGPIWQGWFNCTGPGTIVRIGDPITTAGKTIAGPIIVPAPGHGKWKMYAMAGSIGKGPPPKEAAVVSFDVTVVGVAGATDVTLAAFDPNPVSGDILDYAPQTPGGYTWGFYELSFMQPTLVTDPNYWFTLATVQKGWNPQGHCSVSGDGKTVTKTDGSWSFDAKWVGEDIHIHGQLTTIAAVTSATVVVLTDAISSAAGQSNQTLDVWVRAPDYEGVDENKYLLYRGRRFTDSGQYQGTVSVPGTACYLRGVMPANWTIPAVKNPDGSPNLYTTFRIRLYGVSHANDNPDSGGPPYVLQTVAWQTANWDGSKDYTQLTPLQQPPNQDLTQSAVYGLDPNGAIAGGNGMPLYIQVNGPLYTDITGLNMKTSNDFVVDSTGHLTQQAINLALAYGFDPTNFKGGTDTAHGGTVAGTPLAVNQIAVNSLIAGTALFTNDVIFAYQPNPANSTTDGGKVTINASGLALADNYRSPHFTVAIGAGGITLANTDPNNLRQVALNSNGMSVTAGQYSTTVNATGITLLGPGGSVGITSTDVTINQGHLVITQGSAPSSPQYKIITGPQILDATYSSLAVQVQGVNISPDNSFDMASLISRGLVIYNALDSGSAGSGRVIAALVRDPNSTYPHGGQLILYHVTAGGSHVQDIFLDALTSSVIASNHAYPGRSGRSIGPFTVSTSIGTITLEFAGGVCV